MLRWWWGPRYQGTDPLPDRGGAPPPATCNGGPDGSMAPRAPAKQYSKIVWAACAPLFPKGSGPKPVFERFRCQPRGLIATSRPQLAKQLPTRRNKGKMELTTFRFWCVSWINCWGLLNAYRKSFPSHRKTRISSFSGIER